MGDKDRQTPPPPPPEQPVEKRDERIFEDAPHDTLPSPPPPEDGNDGDAS